MSYKPGDSVAVEFTTSDTSGAAANADALPTGIVNRNGADDGLVNATVTDLDTGRYKAVFALPVGYAAGDSVSLSITATIGGIVAKAAKGPWVLDSKRLADKPSVSLASGDVSGDLPADLQTVKGQVVTATGAFSFDAQTASQTTVAATQTAVNNLNNLSALANLFPNGAQWEIPAAAGSIAYPMLLVIKDAEGHMLDLSGLPTITAANGAGTDRSTNVSAVTHTGTGQYSFTYTVSSTAAQEGIQIKASGTAASDSTARLAYAGFSIVADDTTATLAAIEAQVNKLQFDGTNNVKSTPQTDEAGVTSLLTRVGSPAGASVSADVAAVKAAVGSPMQAGAQVVLASNGLASVSPADPTGSPATWDFRAKLMWLFRRMARSTYDSNASTIVVKDASGTTISTQTATNSGGVQSTGELS